MAAGQDAALKTGGALMVLGGVLSFNFLLAAAGVGVYKAPELTGDSKPAMPPMPGG